jgi:hypothetical protein
MLVLNKFLIVFMIIILMEIIFNSSLFDCLSSEVETSLDSFVLFKNNKLNYIDNIYDIDVKLSNSTLTIITLEYDGYLVDYIKMEELVEDEVYYSYCGSLYRPIDDTLLIYSESVPSETLPYQIVVVGTDCYYIYIGDSTSDSTSEDTTSDSTSEDTTSDSTSGDTTSDSTSGDTTSDSTSGDTTSDSTSGDTTSDSTSGDTTSDSTSGDTTSN